MLDSHTVLYSITVSISIYVLGI